MEAFMSMITAYGCNFVIRSWGGCSGGLLAISQNSALFSLLGTQFGGDGRTSFGLPDLRGRSPVSFGTGPGLMPVAMGQKGGQDEVTLSSLNLPSHHHGVALTGQTAAATANLVVSTDSANQGNPDGNYLGQGAGPVAPYTATLSSPPGLQNNVVEIPAQQVQVNGNTGTTGNNIPVNVQSPYQGVNYQICMYGIYPSRS